MTFLEFRKRFDGLFDFYRNEFDGCDGVYFEAVDDETGLIFLDEKENEEDFWFSDECDDFVVEKGAIKYLETEDNFLIQVFIRKVEEI